MTPPIFDETLLDLRLYLENAKTLVRISATNIAWRVALPRAQVYPPNNNMYLLDNGDVFVEQDMVRYWLWWDMWVGPFTTEDAAYAALMLLL